MTQVGFASLEAKRNFRAPRISPKNSGSGNDSSPLMNQLSDADAGIENDPSLDSLLGQVVQDEDMSLHNSVSSYENYFPCSLISNDVNQVEDPGTLTFVYLECRWQLSYVKMRMLIKTLQLMVRRFI